MSNKEALAELIAKLKQQRDELRVQMHLAKADAKAEYDRICDRIAELSQQYEPVKEAASESTDKVVSALKLAAEEMAAGFKRIRDSFQS